MSEKDEQKEKSSQTAIAEKEPQDRDSFIKEMYQMQQARLLAEISKDSVKINLDAQKKVVKSIEAKAYGRTPSEAAEKSVQGIRRAIEKINEDLPSLEIELEELQKKEEE